MIRKLLVTGMAAFAFTVIAGAGTARAGNFDLNFTHGFASIGCDPDCTVHDASILDATDPSVTIPGNIAGNAVTIPAGQLIQRTVPVEIDPGPPPTVVDVTFTLTAVDPMTGTYDSGTGQIDLTAPHVTARAQADVDGTPIDCTIDPVALTFTTETTTYHPGVRYNHGAPPAGAGALAAAWPNLPTPVATFGVLDVPSSAVCGPILGPYVSGTGGVWLSKDLPTIGNPQPVTSLTSNPASPNEANSIFVKGTGASDPGNVHVFQNDTCAGGSLGTFSSSSFNGAGVGPFTVPEDDTTQFSVRVHDFADRQSGCVAYSYTDPVAPPPPPPGGGSGGGGAAAATPAAGATAGATAPAVKKCKKTQKLKKGRCVKKNKKK